MEIHTPTTDCFPRPRIIPTIALVINLLPLYLQKSKTDSSKKPIAFSEMHRPKKIVEFIDISSPISLRKSNIIMSKIALRQDFSHCHFLYKRLK